MDFAFIDKICQKQIFIHSLNHFITNFFTANLINYIIVYVEIGVVLVVNNGLMRLLVHDLWLNNVLFLIDKKPQFIKVYV